MIKKFVSWLCDQKGKNVEVDKAELVEDKKRKLIRILVIEDNDQDFKKTIDMYRDNMSNSNMLISNNHARFIDPWLHVQVMKVEPTVEEHAFRGMRVHYVFNNAGLKEEIIRPLLYYTSERRRMFHNA